MALSQSAGDLSIAIRVFYFGEETAINRPMLSKPAIALCGFMGVTADAKERHLLHIYGWVYYLVFA
jgi:hypothetical protein